MPSAAHVKEFWLYGVTRLLHQNHQLSIHSIRGIERALYIFTFISLSIGTFCPELGVFYDKQQRKNISWNPNYSAILEAYTYVYLNWPVLGSDLRVRRLWRIAAKPRMGETMARGAGRPEEEMGGAGEKMGEKPEGDQWNIGFNQSSWTENRFLYRRTGGKMKRNERVPTINQAPLL